VVRPEEYKERGNRGRQTEKDYKTAIDKRD